MKKIALMDTSIFTYNLGDQIIMESVKRQLAPVLKGNFVLNIPTHTPFCHNYEYYCDLLFKKNNVKIKDIDYKFVCGTNLLTGNMLNIKNNWNLNIFDSLILKNCILVGVGTNKKAKKTNWYTRRILKNVLSKDFIHSVRDENTKVFLEKIGFKAINTGCCTLWDLTPKHCKEIPTSKSNTVVFTLTDYSKNIQQDKKLIEILKNKYKNIYFWPQGLEDYEYFKKFDNTENIKIIDPSLDEYQKFLKENDCDYIGTRLHGGIKALQLKKRTIIISIDNRARNMGRDYNLFCVERDEIDNLNTIIDEEFTTDIKLDFEKIEKWRSQFNS